MYFSKFPTLKYPIPYEDSFKFVLCRNITRRCGLSKELREGNGIFIQYNIKDGEKPEHIAERIYGDAEMHWIILLTNDIIDPYHDWYKSSIVFERYIQKKYSGYSVFFTKTSGVEATLLYASDIQSGTTLTQGSISDTVNNFEPQFCKVTVQGSGFVAGSAVLGVSGGKTYGIEIRRSVPSYLAVNYFRVYRPIGDPGAQDSVMVDPFSENTASYHSSSAGISDLGLALDEVKFRDTYIGKYMGISGEALETYAVSNHIYEIDKNEKRRTIKILHPRYKDIAIKELESLLRV